MTNYFNFAKCKLFMTSAIYRKPQVFEENWYQLVSQNYGINGETFLTKELCLEHEKSHSGVMAYNCHICEKRGFRQRVRYLTHMSQTHKITIENAYSLVHCNHCNKTLMSQTDLEYHEEKEHSVQILINKSYDALAAQNVSRNIENTLVENVI